MPYSKQPIREETACWVEIDLSSLRRNFRIVRQRTIPDTPVISIIKANAYGHGVIPVARVLVEEGSSILGVANVNEARELRMAGISGRVMVMGRTIEAELEKAVRWNVELTIPYTGLAKKLSAIAARLGHPMEVHLKVDTGMSRLGIPWQHALQEASIVRDLPSLELVGIYTHFANADLADTKTTTIQIQRFEEVRSSLRKSGFPENLYHLANSAAVLTSRSPEGTGVRPGIMLYGAAPSLETATAELSPILAWKCRVIQVKDVPPGTGISYGHDFITSRESRIATIAVGYADGYPRSLTNCGQVLLGGMRVPVVGRVTMDMTMVDITGMNGILPGDEAVLIGKQGDVSVTADEIADLCHTINYEIFCGISSRVPRFYHDEGLKGSVSKFPDTLPGS